MPSRGPPRPGKVDEGCPSMGTFPGSSGYVAVLEMCSSGDVQFWRCVAVLQMGRRHCEGLDRLKIAIYRRHIVKLHLRRQDQCDNDEERFFPIKVTIVA